MHDDHDDHDHDENDHFNDDYIRRPGEGGACRHDYDRNEAGQEGREWEAPP